MSHRMLLWPLIVPLLLALLLAACDDEGGETPTTAPTPTAAAASPSPGVTGTPASSISPQPTASPGSNLTVDLAAVTPLLTIFAGAPSPPAIDQPTGDLRNDVASLAVGDFNDDGIDDLLIGARFADGPDDSRKDAGEAYVIFGSRSLGGTVDLAQGQQGMTILGAKENDNLGFGVLAADINNDGVDDIIVSAPLSEGPEADVRTDRGEVYTIFGRSDLPKIIDIAEGTQDFAVTAAEGFSLLGDSMASGDINGDGIADMVLGAPFAGREPGTEPGGPRTQLGEIYVIFGSSTLGGRLSIPQGQQDATLSGPEQWSELGDALAVGDVNGDDIDDIIAVAEAADWPDADRANVGIAYVVFGSSELEGLVDLAEDQQDVTIIGADKDDALGFSASSGDVNDDGIDDILLVAQRADGPPGRQISGAAYLIFGSADLGGTIDVLDNDQDATIGGAESHTLLSSCDAGPDINNDGAGDILLGTGFIRTVDGSRQLAGAGYVVFGPVQSGAILDLASTDADVVFYGAEAGDLLGGAIHAADLNGDGRLEIILAATDADGPDNSRTDAGELYIISLPDGQ
jgi:hypothetical protein